MRHEVKHENRKRNDDERPRMQCISSVRLERWRVQGKWTSSAALARDRWELEEGKVLCGGREEIKDAKIIRIVLKSIPAMSRELDICVNNILALFFHCFQ